MTATERKAADLVDEAARVIDPAIKPSQAADLAKQSLPDMSYWLMDLRLSLRFKSGPLEGMDADLAVVSITPEDAAMLERIADTLNYLHHERLKSKSRR